MNFNSILSLVAKPEVLLGAAVTFVGLNLLTGRKAFPGTITEAFPSETPTTPTPAATAPTDSTDDTGDDGGDGTDPTDTATPPVDCATFCASQKAGATGQLAESVYPTNIYQFLYGAAAHAKKKKKKGKGKGKHKGGKKHKGKGGGGGGHKSKGGGMDMGTGDMPPIPDTGTLPTPPSAGLPDTGMAPPDTDNPVGVPPCDCSTINATGMPPDVSPPLKVPTTPATPKTRMKMRMKKPAGVGAGVAAFENPYAFDDYLFFTDDTGADIQESQRITIA
jgi:hypothetical protein